MQEKILEAKLADVIEIESDDDDQFAALGDIELSSVAGGEGIVMF